MKFYILLVFFIVTLSSCSFYKPSVINTPILEKKGDVNVGFATINGTNVNASYAFTNHFAISSSFTCNIYASLLNANTNSFENVKTINNKYEFALGYFNDQEQLFNYSFFTGYALGNVGTQYTQSEITSLVIGDPFIGSEFQSFFIQGAGFSKIGENSHFGLVSKFRFIELSKFRFSESFSNANPSYRISNKTHTVTQLGIQYLYKKRVFGITSQLQFAFSTSNDNYFSVRKLGIHIGGYYRLNELFKRRD